MNSGARKLYAWRRRMGLTQVEVSAMLRVAQSLLSRWERGVQNPGRAFSFRLAKITQGAVPIESWDRGTQDEARE